MHAIYKTIAWKAADSLKISDEGVDLFSITNTIYVMFIYIKMGIFKKIWYWQSLLSLHIIANSFQFAYLKKSVLLEQECYVYEWVFLCYESLKML